MEILTITSIAPTLEQLQIRSEELYPDSINLQNQWVKWSDYLYSHNKHVLQTGNYPNATRTIQ